MKSVWNKILKVDLTNGTCDPRICQMRSMRSFWAGPV